MEQPLIDQEFASKLPKIELHAHLSGSISRKCLHEIWLAKSAAKRELEVDDPLIVIPPGKVDYDLKTFFPLFDKYIYTLCSDIPSIRMATLRVLEDFEADNVVYLELRTTPREVPEYTISKRRYVETVLTVIEEYERDTTRRLHTRLILSVDRKNTLAEAKETIDLALELQSRGVVGVDLCGNPTVGPIVHLSPAFYEAKLSGLKITLHFAEAEVSSSDTELRTLLSWQPDRLGHVIRVNDEFKETIMSKNIGLELCLSCNVHAKMITGSFSDHHFREWRKVHKNIALSTDDVGIFCSPLSNEYYLAAQHFHLSRKELTETAENVVDMIFGDDEEKARLRSIYNNWRLGQSIQSGAGAGGVFV